MKYSSIIVLGVFFLFVLPLVSSSTSCSLTLIQKSWIQGTTPDSTTFTCTNNNNVTSVILTKLGNYFSLSPSSPITIQPLASQNIQVNFDSQAITGIYNGFLTFNDGTSEIAINMNVSAPQQQGCVIDIFPITMSGIKIEAGQTKTRNIQLSVPSCYPSSVNVNGVVLQTDERPIQLSEINLGILQPGRSLSVPIELNAVDVSTGQYSDTLQFLVYDDEGQRINLPSVSISVLVTAGVQPVDQTSFSTPPSCTLSATQLSLNNTYSFTCSNINPNLNVEIAYNDLFTGQMVDVSSGLYKYSFIPRNYGTANFTAVFKYRGAPIFPAFQQQIIVSQAGAVQSGTILKLLFTPSLSEAEDGETVLIQVADNSTGSLVPNPRLFINARELNSSSETFEYVFHTDTDYELRAVSSNYNDLTQTVQITTQPIEITVSPSSGDTSTFFNITTNTDNVTLFINEIKVTYPFYATLISGVNVIKAVKENYQTKIINITVGDSLRAISGGDIFEKNVLQRIVLSKVPNQTAVYYKKDANQIDREEFISQLKGDVIEFTPTKAGWYYVEADGKTVYSNQITGVNWGAKWWFMAWYFWIILGFLLIVFLYFVFRRNHTDVSNVTPYS